MANQGDMPPPTSDEVGGCKSFRKARESGNPVNASTVHPSSAGPSPSSVTGKESSEHEGWDFDDLSPGRALYVETVYKPVVLIFVFYWLSSISSFLMFFISCHKLPCSM